MERKLYCLKGGLKKARKNKGLTQHELAQKINVHPKTVMNWEQGIAVPSLENIMQLSDILDCDIDYLTGKLEEQTHDIQFIHDQIGLTGEAVKKLQENRGLAFVLSLLIEQTDFIPLLWEINQKLLQDLDDDLTGRENDKDIRDLTAFQIYRYLMRILEDIPSDEFMKRL